jgi:hypothetical protein
VYYRASVSSAPFLYTWIEPCHDGLQGANEVGVLHVGALPSIPPHRWPTLLNTGFMFNTFITINKGGSLQTGDIMFIWGSLLDPISIRPSNQTLQPSSIQSNRSVTKPTRFSCVRNSFNKKNLIFHSNQLITINLIHHYHTIVINHNESGHLLSRKLKILSIPYTILTILNILPNSLLN